ncbi:MAG: hypothetical protein K8T91_16590 [Planctomycetes bacterium]|nr:hypothetical protein [Planctomycetota bacterium]
MVRVTIDMATMAKLHNLDSYLEFLDPSGRLIGHFLPATDRSLYEGVDSPTPPEEIDRRLEEETGRPLKDILRDLEARQ